MKSDKQILEKNVKEISNIIFGNLELGISVFSKEESLGYSERQFDFVCEIEINEEQIKQEQIEKLSKFINKEVQKTSRKIFWFVGTNGYSTKYVKNSKSKELQKDVTLPQFLDNFIFNKLKAKFAPDYTKFNKNLNHHKEDVLIYLGTYFPRSFAETYSIFNNILQNDIIEKSNKEKEEINILDIGSGTGGNLSGLLLSLIENISQKININIVAIDGNKEALKFLEKIVFQIQLKYSLNISLKCHYVAFETVNDLYDNSKQFFEPNFDFIISSKMINEIITKDEESYFNYYRYFAKYLNNIGLLLMLDITTKIKVNYMPILLNNQSNYFIQNNKDGYKTLIPTSCSENESICKQDCFSNNIFFVTHSKKRNDKSKVAYRIIGKKEFVLDVLSTTHEIGGIIGWDNDRIPKYCAFTSSDNNSKNSYKI